MSTLTRPRTSVPSTPERGERPTDSLPGGPRRRVRRRRLASLAVVLAVSIGIALAVLVSGTSNRAPATGAAEIVPADVLAYVHLSTDGTLPGVQRAQMVARRFPDYPLAYATVINRLNGIVGGSSSDLGTGIRPWLGKEAALALLDTSGASASSLIVLDVKAPAAAWRFVTAAGAAPVAVYDGVQVLGYSSGTELAFVRNYLVVGPDAGVRAAIAAAAGRAPSLGDDPVYKRATVGEPAGRVLDAYLPAAGVRRVLERQTGIIGALGVLLDRPALMGTAVSVSAVSAGADVQVHSALRASASPSGGSRPSSFKHTLQAYLPSGSTLMLDVDGLDRAAPGLLEALARAGVAGKIAPLLRRLGAALVAEGVNLHQIVSIFHGETAVALSPGPSPSLMIVSRISNETATRAELAGLEAPLAALFPAPTAGPGQIPGLRDHHVGGVTVREFGVGPGLQVDYAVFNGLVVVSTSSAAIDEVVTRTRSLGSEPYYQNALAGRRDRVSSVLFTDFRQLLSLGEQTGLTGSPRVRAWLGDLAKVRTIGLSSTGGQSYTTTELHIKIQ